VGDSTAHNEGLSLPSQKIVEFVPSSLGLEVFSEEFCRDILLRWTDDGHSIGVEKGLRTFVSEISQ
jgi:hypothetical protein